MTLSKHERLPVAARRALMGLLVPAAVAGAGPEK